MAAGLYVPGSMKEEGSILPDRQRLSELREAMLLLHKTLLESERVTYEATFGKIQSPYQFLTLVMDDPWFAWLAPMTQLITAMSGPTREFSTSVQKPWPWRKRSFQK